MVTELPNQIIIIIIYEFFQDSDLAIDRYLQDLYIYLLRTFASAMRN